MHSDALGDAGGDEGVGLVEEAPDAALLLRDRLLVGGGQAGIGGGVGGVVRGVRGVAPVERRARRGAEGGVCGGVSVVVVSWCSGLVVWGGGG